MWTELSPGEFSELQWWESPCPCKFECESVSDLAKILGVADSAVLPDWETLKNDFFNWFMTNRVVPAAIMAENRDQTPREEIKRQRGRPSLMCTRDEILPLYIALERASGSRENVEEIFKWFGLMPSNQEFKSELLDGCGKDWSKNNGVPPIFTRSDGNKARRKHLRNLLKQQFVYVCECSGKKEFRSLSDRILVRLSEVSMSMASMIEMTYFVLNPAWIVRKFPELASLLYHENATQ